MERNLTIDNLRGIAFLLMVFQHIFYFYDVSTNYTTNYRSIEIVNNAGTISRNLFILLAGYSVYMSYKSEQEKDKKEKKTKNDYLEKRIKRSTQIMEHAVLITIVTYLLYPDKFIQFGILHFLSIGTLLISFVAPNKIATVIALLISLFATYPVTGTFADIITGSSATGIMMDWFPLNKWLPVLLSGLVIGQNIDLKSSDFEFDNTITDIGKNSLNLYTGHLIFLLIAFKFV
jgi:uncharacterized membrane protein